MTSMHALGVLAIRLLAVWLLVMTMTHSVGSAGMVIQVSRHPEFSADTALVAATLAGTAVVGVVIPLLMILLARRIIGWMIPSDAPDIEGLSLDAEGLSRLAMSMIGLFLIADSLPEIGGQLVRVADAWRRSAAAGSPDFGQYVSITPSLPEYSAAFVFGVGLFLAAFRIGPFLRPLRRAGKGASMDDDSTAPSQSDV